MRAYMLEKLVLVVNNARIIYNRLQPSRKPLGIHKACESVVMELIQPLLDQERAFRQRKKQKKDMGDEKIRRNSSGSSKKTWQSAMISDCKHLPSQVKRQPPQDKVITEEQSDPRRKCRQCSRAGREQSKAKYYCKGCQGICGREVFLHYNFDEEGGYDRWREWHSSDVQPRFLSP